MANPTGGIVRKQVDPSLKDLLDLVKKDIMLSTNCHAVGTIQSFDPETQTVTATINYKKSYNQMGEDGVYKIVSRNYPLLLDVPIVVLGGGGANLTMPIITGDTCLILFHDRDLDNWLQTGQIVAPASSRLHSFSDGIALVGLNSMAKLIQNYDPIRAVLRNGNAMVGVGPELVKIANEMTTLNTLLQSLITTIKGLTTTNAVVGSPCAVSTITQTALTSLGTQIAGLLE